MNKTYFRAASMVSMCLIATILAAAPTYARGGTDETATESSHVETTQTSTTPVQTTSTMPATTSTTQNSGKRMTASKAETEKPKVKAEAETETEHAQENEKHTEDKLHTRGSELLVEARKNGKEHTKDERLQNCTTKKVNIEKRLTTIQTNSKKHLDTINAVLARIQTARASTMTPLVDYDALLASAIAAQAQATSSVDAMGALSSSIDCGTDTAAANIATFKAAADQARTDLKTYRTSVKAILGKIETANTSEKADQ